MFATLIVLNHRHYTIKIESLKNVYITKLFIYAINTVLSYKSQCTNRYPEPVQEYKKNV
jgi:hypothetical protein